MLNYTPIARPFFVARAKSLTHHADDLERVQRRTLLRLLRIARSTEIGREFGFSSISGPRHYAERVPLMPYEQIRPQVMRMVAGERDVLWPGVTRRFAQSSGTSDGRSKFIPVTDASLHMNHYVGSSSAVAEYLKLYPDSKIFGGRSFILGGSFATALENVPAHVRVGDLSANMIEAMPSIAGRFRIPASKDVALMADWKEKLPALVRASAKADVRSISGVPSWFLTVIREVMKEVGADSIHDVWPNLEVFFHGGISFGPYREQYKAITDPSKMHYLETYNASEGFFAVQDRREPGAMLLLPDVGIYYEFEPLDGGNPVPAWEVEQGRVYALILSAPNGLWRYSTGDTVKIETVSPLRISIAGRTKLFINAFGEELMVYNSDAALASTCSKLGCEVSDYTAAPVYTTDHSRGRHQWLVEFSGREPDIERFASELDMALCNENSDYAAKRAGSIFLDPVEVIPLPEGTFNSWLESTGKLGGQRKVPRLCPDRRIADAILNDTESLRHSYT
ncbi:MAG: GH3 auxin-responsive promoter family protein [Muribaculaceae bacterium]|nr:GH3 auxin-responsive promoter family protein [Muribaculaceae bacterium]